MKTESLKELQEAVRILDITRNNASQDNLEDTKTDIDLALKSIRAALFVETRTPSRKFDLYKFASKDEMRPMMGGVNHLHGYRVASDSHILAAVKEDYDESLEGQTIGRKGETLIGKYPKWEYVFPSPAEMTPHDIDTSKVYDLIKQSRAEKKAAGKYGEYRRGIVKCGDTIFDAETFGKFATFMDAYGIKTIQTQTQRWGAALAQAEDGSKGLIMPIDGRRVMENYDKYLWYEVS